MHARRDGLVRSNRRPARAHRLHKGPAPESLSSKNKAPAAPLFLHPLAPATRRFQRSTSRFHLDMARTSETVRPANTGSRPPSPGSGVDTEPRRVLRPRAPPARYPQAQNEIAGPSSTSRKRKGSDADSGRAATRKGAATSAAVFPTPSEGAEDGTLRPNPVESDGDKWKDASDVPFTKAYLRYSPPKPRTEARNVRQDLRLRWGNHRPLKAKDANGPLDAIEGDNVRLHVGDITKIACAEGHSEQGFGYLLLLHAWYNDGNQYVAGAWFWNRAEAKTWRGADVDPWPKGKTHVLSSEVEIVHAKALDPPLKAAERDGLYWDREFFDFDLKQFQPIGDSETCDLAMAVRRRQSSPDTAEESVAAPSERVSEMDTVMGAPAVDSPTATAAQVPVAQGPAPTRNVAPTKHLLARRERFEARLEAVVDLKGSKTVAQGLPAASIKPVLEPDQDGTGTAGLAAAAREQSVEPTPLSAGKSGTALASVAQANEPEQHTPGTDGPTVGSSERGHDQHETDRGACDKVPLDQGTGHGDHSASNADDEEDVMRKYTYL